MAKFTLAVCLGLLLIALVVSGQEPETRDVKPGKTFCTKEFSPVCGSDGKTYGNMCEFGNAKAVKSDLTFTTGACDEPSK